MKKVIKETASTADTDPENYIGPEVDPDTGDVLCKNGKKPGSDGCPESEDDSEHVDRIKDKTKEPESILREWQDFGIDARGNVVHRFGVTRDEVESARSSGSKSGLLISDSYLGLIGAGLMEAHEIDILNEADHKRYPEYSVKQDDAVFAALDKKDKHKGLLNSAGDPTAKGHVKDASRYGRRLAKGDMVLGGLAQGTAKQSLANSPNRPVKPGDIKTLTRGAVDEVYGSVSDQLAASASAQKKKDIHKGLLTSDGKPTAKRFVKDASSFTRKSKDPDNTEAGSAIAKFDAHDRANMALDASPNRKRKASDMSTLVKEAHEIDILEDSRRKPQPTPSALGKVFPGSEVVFDSKTKKQIHKDLLDKDGGMTPRGVEKMKSQINRTIPHIAINTRVVKEAHEIDILGEDSKEPKSYDTKMLTQTSANDSLDTIATFAHMRTGAEINPKKQVPVADLKKKPAFTPPKTKSPTGDEFHLQHADSGEYVAPLGKTTTDPSQASVRSLSGAITTGRQKQTVATSAGGEKPKFKVVAAGGDTKKPAYVVDQKTPANNVISEVNQLLGEGFEKKVVHKGLMTPDGVTTTKGLARRASSSARYASQVSTQGAVGTTQKIAKANAEDALAKSPNRPVKPGDMETLTRGAVKEDTEVKKPTLQENSPLVRHMTSLETGLWMKEASDEKKKKKKEDDDEKDTMSKSEVADGIQKHKKEVTKVLETYYAASGSFLDEEEVFQGIEALSEELGANLSSGRAFDVKPNVKPGLKLMFKDHTSNKRIGKG